MKLSALIVSIAGAAVLALTASVAQATTDSFVYTSTTSAPSSATGMITFHSIGGGVYEITDITGFVDGDKITNLVPNSNPPGAVTSTDGLFIYDNDVYSGAPTLSNPGVLFDGQSGIEYNLFSQGPSYVLYEGVNNAFGPNSVGTFALAGGAPESATWLMMVMGVAAIGAGLRMERGRQLANA